MKKLLNRFTWASRVMLIIYVAAVLVLCLVNIPTVEELPKTIFGIPLDKVLHFCMFLPYPILIYGSFHNMTSRPYGHMLMLMTIILSGLGFAFGIEFLQGLTESRSAEFLDFIADALGLFTSSFIILCASAIYHKW